MKFKSIEELRSVPEIEMLVCSVNVVCKEEKPVFFYHIPKSAGISFKAALTSAIRGKALFQGASLAKYDFRFEMYFDGAYSVYAKKDFDQV